VYEAVGYMHARAVQAATSIDARLRSQAGQGTVEYVALVLLVALVMFGVVTAMKTYRGSEGQELGDLILQKIKEAVAKVKY
jgi:Flp pilus assembly pilin Flp